MVIKSGEIISAADSTESHGNPLAQLAYEQVKSDSSNWTNTDYLGADIFSDSNGAKNTVDTSNTFSSYDSGSDYYAIPDISDINYYAIVEASSYSGSAGVENGVFNFDDGKWLIFDPNAGSNSTEVERAIVHKILWASTVSGTSDDTTGIMEDFTSVTSLKISDSDDVGFRGYFKYITANGTGTRNSTGTFGTTTGNTVSSWSNIRSTGDGSTNVGWQCPEGTTLNSTDGNDSSWVEEIGIDRSSDEKTNPSDCRAYTSQSAGHTGLVYVQAVIFTKGTLSWVDTDVTNVEEIDYYTDYSIPETTQADTLANEGIGDGGTYASSSTVETNTIIDEVVPKSIVVYGKTDLPTDTSITVDVSDDGGSTWSLTDQELNTYIDTSTFTTGNLALKFNLATTDTSATPKLYGYSVCLTDS